MSAIEWTMRTWNFILGCLRVSPGCMNCYAEGQVHRKMAPQHHGLTVLKNHGPAWNGKWHLVPHRLDETCRRQNPTTWFVNSLSDFFYEKIPYEIMAAGLGLMAATPRHTYQILTKRPEHGVRFFDWYVAQYGATSEGMLMCARELLRSRGVWVESPRAREDIHSALRQPPSARLPNVHIGVSVEDDVYRERRVEALRRIPTVVPWVSQEPQLARVTYADSELDFLKWIVVGGEAHAGARHFDLDWLRHTIEQCDGRLPLFVKQLGAKPGWTTNAGHGWVSLAGHYGTKGQNVDDWPEWARIREMPDV